MLNWIIDFSLRHRFLVVAAALAFAVAGALSLRKLDIDAFPDTTPMQVQINTVAPALGPEEVEKQITFPVEQAIGALPHLQGLRSISKFGLSQVVVTFDDGTDIYFARQLINERLTTVELPAGIERPKMGPIATGLGEVFHYIVTSRDHDLTELRTLHDWSIKPKMRTVKGVAEINSWGGMEKQYQVRIDPDRLIKHRVTFDEVAEALDKNNRNIGGGSIRQNSQSLLVQGVGRLTTVEQIRNVVVTAKGGDPVKVGAVANVEIGSEIRRGTVTADGKGEVVLGLGFMLMGENSHEVTWAMKDKLDDLKTTFPKDLRGRPTVKAEPVYDRTELVTHVIDTVRNNLFEAGLLVVAVLFLFLGDLRAAAIVALAIPLSLLFAFCGMLRFGISASLLSLGAIDFGMVVDSSVVMVENCVRHIARDDPTHRSKLEMIRDAAIEVRKPTLFGELIIMVVYLPILTLEGIEGKLFRPMALTVLFALAGSMILSMTLMPVLASLLLPRRIREREPLLMRLARWLYTPLLNLTMRYKLAVVALTLAALVFAFGVIAPQLGSEFVPQLSEGAVVLGIMRPPGTDLEECVRANTQMEKALLAAFPDEIRHVWSRVGAPEVATDPMGVEETDMFISLKPRDQWTRAHTQDELVALMQEELRPFRGQKIDFSQPIQQRINEMISGARSDVAVKIFGDDLDILKDRAADVERILKTVDGNADVKVQQVTGQPVLRVTVDQDQIARYGISEKVVLDLVESVGSKPLGEVVEGQLRFPLVARLPENRRTSPEAIRALLISTASGERIPLSRLAKVETVEGPSTISREWGQRRIVVTANVRGRDSGSFVAEARHKVAESVQLPPGRYHIEWGGQFEHYESARTRLIVVFIVALALILALLYAAYGNVVDALRVLPGVPLGWVGGIIALWLRGMPFSISAGVGFIALSGVAVLDDMILVSYIRQLRRQGVPRDEAVRRAAVTRLRPVLMTTLVASLGFLPMAFSTGMGAEVQRPLATVVIGGVVSAMVMSLLVIRVLYIVFDGMARAGQRFLTRCFGLRAEKLTWLFGDSSADAASHPDTCTQ